MRFLLHEDGTISLYESDGKTAWNDKNWCDRKTGDSGLTAYIDVYNKPFHFKIMKMDGEEQNVMLDGAHFVLFKQMNTTISGYVKNAEPLTGFEDMVTVNGEVDVCGGNSGRVLSQRQNGAVYFLTETQAPFHYAKLEEDIMFRVDALGVPTLLSDACNSRLEEQADCYVYSLSVPNTKIPLVSHILSIRKEVDGSFGDREREFEFTITIENQRRATDSSGRSTAMCSL